MATSASSNKKLKTSLEIARRRGVVIVVDNSNLWIEGKKAAGAKLATNEDPMWRLHMGNLLALVVQDDEDIAVARIFGSVPPPVDSVWKTFESVAEVDLSKRSAFTGKEKRVDTKAVTLLAQDVGMLQMAQALGHVNVLRRYVVVSGDADFMPPIKAALEAGFRVDIWSWKRATHSEARKCEHSLLCAHDLTEHITELGFRETQFDIKEHDIPRERSFVFTSKSKSQRKKETENSMKYFCLSSKWPLYTYDVDDGCTLLVVLHYEMTADAFEMFFQAAVNAVADDEDIEVLNYPNYISATKGSKFKISANHYWLKEDQADEQIQHDTDDDDHDHDNRSNVSAHTDDDNWQTVRSKKKPGKPKFTKMCFYKEFCYKGESCTWGHSEEELELFQGPKGGYGKGLHRLKTKSCVKHCPKTAWKKCQFLHDNEPQLCISCLQLGCRQQGSCHSDRGLISDDRIRELRSDNYVK